jgi:hypothetical protein
MARLAVTPEMGKLAAYEKHARANLEVERSIISRHF